MRYSRICIHLSMTTSISYFLWRLGHFFKETQPSFPRFLDSFFSPQIQQKQIKVEPSSGVSFFKGLPVQMFKSGIFW